MAFETNLNVLKIELVFSNTEFLLCTLAGRDGLSLFLDARLLIVLTFAQLGENARLLALLFKTPHGGFEGFSFFDFYTWHGMDRPPLKWVDGLKMEGA